MLVVKCVSVSQLNGLFIKVCVCILAQLGELNWTFQIPDFDLLVAAGADLVSMNFLAFFAIFAIFLTKNPHNFSEFSGLDSTKAISDTNLKFFLKT